MAMPPQLAAALAGKGNKKKANPQLQAAAAKRVADFADGLTPEAPSNAGRFSPKKKAAKKGATDNG